MASPLFEERQHQLHVSVPAEGLPVSGDPVRLAQVVMNLLTNAAKYTQVGGRIDIRAERDAGNVALSVKDNGAGISPTLLPRVFELFTQEAQAPDRSLGGLGLGLTIVRSLVQLHGGTVEARSAGSGLGSEFVIRLPALPARRQESLERPSPLQRAAARRLKVLVVDDNADAAQMIGDALGAAGDLVRVALDGPSALTEAAAFQPDVALLDLGLPVMDGYELGQELRAQLRRPPALIAVTGYGQEEDRQRSRAAGFYEHVVKPVDLEALNDLLDRLAPAGGALRERRRPRRRREPRVAPRASSRRRSPRRG